MYNKIIRDTTYNNILGDKKMMNNILENKFIELNENEKETLNGGNGWWDASMIGICAAGGGIIGGIVGGAFTAGAGTGAGVALGSHYAAIGCTAIRYL